MEYNYTELLNQLGASIGKAKNNDIFEQCKLGKYYKFGLNGTAKNKHTAFYWFERSSLLGNSAAQLELAICYDLGIGCVRSKKTAEYWYGVAAKSYLYFPKFIDIKLLEINVEQKKTQAFLDYALVNFYGYKMDINYEKAIKYFTAISEYFKNNVKTNVPSHEHYWIAQIANYYLGWMYDHGLGDYKSLSKAHQKYLLASNHPRAQYNLALDFKYDWGIPNNSNQKFFYYHYIMLSTINNYAPAVQLSSEDLCPAIKTKNQHNLYFKKISFHTKKYSNVKDIFLCTAGMLPDWYQKALSSIITDTYTYLQINGYDSHEKIIIKQLNSIFKQLNSPLNTMKYVLKDIYFEATNKKELKNQEKQLEDFKLSIPMYFKTLILCTKAFKNFKDIKSGYYNHLNEVLNYLYEICTTHNKHIALNILFCISQLLPNISKQSPKAMKKIDAMLYAPIFKVNPWAQFKYDVKYLIALSAAEYGVRSAIHEIQLKSNNPFDIPPPNMNPTAKVTGYIYNGILKNCRVKLVRPYYGITICNERKYQQLYDSAFNVLFCREFKNKLIFEGKVKNNKLHGFAKYYIEDKADKAILVALVRFENNQLMRKMTVLPQKESHIEKAINQNIYISKNTPFSEYVWQKSIQRCVNYLSRGMFKYNFKNKKQFTKDLVKFYGHSFNKKCNIQILNESISYTGSLPKNSITFAILFKIVAYLGIKMKVTESFILNKASKNLKQIKQLLIADIKILLKCLEFCRYPLKEFSKKYKKSMLEKHKKEFIYLDSVFYKLEKTLDFNKIPVSEKETGNGYDIKFKKHIVDFKINDIPIVSRSKTNKKKFLKLREHSDLLFNSLTQYTPAGDTIKIDTGFFSIYNSKFNISSGGHSIYVRFKVLEKNKYQIEIDNYGGGIQLAKENSNYVLRNSVWENGKCIRDELRTLIINCESKELLKKYIDNLVLSRYMYNSVQSIYLIYDLDHNVFANKYKSAAKKEDWVHTQLVGNCTQYNLNVDFNKKMGWNNMKFYIQYAGRLFNKLEQDKHLPNEIILKDINIAVPRTDYHIVQMSAVNKPILKIKPPMAEPAKPAKTYKIKKQPKEEKKPLRYIEYVEETVETKSGGCSIL